MSNYLPDTPSVARFYCPGCEPDADPLSEILDIRRCAAHVVVEKGIDDEVVISEAFLSGSTEAGGFDNREWCKFFHRERPPEFRPPGKKKKRK